MNTFLLDQITRKESHFGIVCRKSYFLIYAHKLIKCLLSDSMVDISGLGEGFKVVSFGLIEVAHFYFHLVSFEVIQILYQIVFLENYKPESLILFNMPQSLLVLYSVIQAFIFIILGIRKHVEESLHFLFQNIKFILVTDGCFPFFKSQIKLLSLHTFLFFLDKLIDIELIVIIVAVLF